MKALAQAEIISLIADLNTFAENADRLISATQSSYNKDKKLLLNRHSSELSSLDNTYKSNCQSVQNQSKKTISDAKKILAEINKLDDKLAKVDKYYVKTKKKKEILLSDTTSSEYSDATEYFETLGRIKESFNTLFKKYSEDILPGLINGLNYLFSSQRKKDYEELIILKNTVEAFVKEIESELPAVTDDHLTALKENYFTQRGRTIERHKNEEESFENSYSDKFDTVAGEIYSSLDEVLPDEFVEYLFEIMQNYNKSSKKVNSSSTIQDEVLNMCFVDFPVDFFVQSPVVASIIKEKCSRILVEDSVRLPIIMSIKDAPVWTIINDRSNTSIVQTLTHSIMFGLLSSCPVEKLTFTIVDPENRGNSISPYFDAKKKLPDLFGEKIYISKDEIVDKVRLLNEKIENILQDKLGNQFESIFDYSQNNSEYNLTVEFLLLYDFPKGFDERTLADLRNILRNGSKCGIYTLISYIPEPENNLSREYEQNLKTILELTTLIKQNGTDFIFHGLPIIYYLMPDKTEFSKFFSKYMLIYEGIKNRGIAFSSIIRELIEAKDSMDLDVHIDNICSMMSNYEKTYAKVPEINATFPSLVTLGNVLYPADVFSDSIGYKHIIDKFGIEHHGNTESTSYVELPLIFDLGNSFNLFLSCPEESSNGMLTLTHHVIWSFLSYMPITKVNVCVFDPEKRGNSISPFLDFRQKLPDIFDQKIYTNQEMMIDCLQKIDLRIDEFIQDKLGNRYKNILDYNVNTPNRAEPITLLILYDFPSGLDGRSIDILSQILRNGNKCGVFTIICHNPSITFSRYENIDERIEQLMKYCAAIDYKDGHYNLLPYNLQVNIPSAPLSKDIDNFINEYVNRAETVKKQGLSFKDIILPDLFSLDSTDSLKIPIGVGDGDSIVNICIGEGSSHHCLIAGATGSGKSTLLHTLIMSSMLHYSPDQLHLYLMDFKSGTEFKIYESAKLPHIQLLAIDAMQEFGESILENLVSEMESRSQTFKDEAGGVSKISDYIKVTGKRMPRILVIIDEFQVLFNDATNRKVANHCAELTKKIVTEGRSFGVHLFMATQSTKIISDLTIASGTIEQMRIRIGLKCGEYDARYLFSDKNDAKALSLMKGPIGTAVMNLDYVEQSNIGFKAAYCDAQTQRYYLDLISQAFANENSSVQIFEGSRTINLLDHFADSDVRETSELPVQIHMGTLIKVAPPFVISIDRKKKHNLLICGSNEKMANIISNNYIISALINRNATVYCIDGDKLVGDDSSAELYDTLAKCNSRFKVAENRADAIKFIGEVYQIYQSRKKQNMDTVIFVIIKNLQFLDIIKSMLKGDMIDESEYLDDEQSENNDFSDPMAAFNAIANFSSGKNSGDSLSAGEKLIKVIEDGSGFGINFVITSLEYQSVKDCMYYGENILSKFPERIIFSLNNNDAESLIESVSVDGLRSNTVYYTDGVKNTFQMKPYIAPSVNELKKYLVDSESL